MSESRSIICRQGQAELEVNEEYYRELQGQEIECPECQAKVSVGKEPCNPRSR